MVAGQIGWLPVQLAPYQYAPALRVCDGSKTATKLFGVVANWDISVRSPVANGDVMIASQRVNGVIQYYQLVIGYSGVWYRTQEVWVRQVNWTAGLAGEIAVYNNRWMPTGLPILALSIGVNNVWACPTGWVQN